MRSLLDVNFLLALSHGGHEHHGVARAWMDEQDSVGDLLICRVVQLGYCRLLSNRHVMGQDARSAAEAWRMGELLLEDERFAFVAEPRGIDRWIRHYASRGKGKGSDWTDTYLAAFARSGGARLVSFDQDFQEFAGIDFTWLGRLLVASKHQKRDAKMKE